MEEKKVNLVKVGIEVDRRAEAAAKEKEKAAAAALLPSDHFQWKRNQESYSQALKESDQAVDALHAARADVADAERLLRKGLSLLINSSGVLLLNVSDFVLYQVLVKGYEYNGVAVLKRGGDVNLLKRIGKTKVKFIVRD